MDEDIQKLLKEIDRVKEKRQGQYLNNIADICTVDYGWQRSMTSAIVCEAINQRAIYTAMSGQNVSYRRSDCLKVCIESDIESVETQTEPNQTSQHEFFQEPNVRLQNDHEEFKRFIHGEILAIKAQVANRSSSSTKENSSNESTNGNYLHEALIRSLQERIISLEKQLNDKQRIIGKILDGPSLHSIKHNVNNQGTKATPPPMGIGQNHVCNKATAVHNGYHDNLVEGLPISNNTRAKEHGNTKAGNQRSSIPKPEEKQDKKSNQGKTMKQSKSARKNITIIGDSILNGLEEAGMQKDHNVKVRAHSGATTRDIVDHIKPVVRKRPSCIIIHSGTNDLTQGIDTIENMKSAIEETRQESPGTEIVLSTVVIRKDKQAMDKKLNVKEINTKIKNFAKDLNVQLIDNSNIDTSCLSRKQLHLNRKGDSLLANNYIRFIKSF